MYRTQIIGRLGSDAERKQGNNGNSYITYRLAVDEPKSNGERETVWLFCKQVVKEGSRIVDFLKKGTQIYAEGKISAFMLKDDNDPKLGFFVFKLELLGSGNGQKKQNDDVPF